VVVLERGVEDLLHRRAEAVDLVDEQHLARLEVGEDRREVAGALEHRTRRRAQGRAHLVSDDVRERGLAETRRPEQQHVVEHLARSRAAWMNTLRLSVILRWPMYSASRRGRSVASTPRSSGEGVAERMSGATGGL
jgi:hypothetical protein